MKNSDMFISILFIVFGVTGMINGNHLLAMTFLILAKLYMVSDDIEGLKTMLKSINKGER